jgi:hypothetical protein
VKRWALHLSLLASTACVTRCGCTGDEDLAELTTLSGSEIDRDRAVSEGNWFGAALGDRFQVGDGLRTGGLSSADLALLPSGQAHVEPHTLVRFLANAPENPSRQMAVETGAITIVAQQIDLEIHTPRAIARVPRGAKLKLSTVEGRERFDVLVGRVVVAHEGVVSTVEQALPLRLEAAGKPLAAEPEAPRQPSAAESSDAPTPTSDAAAETLAPDASPSAAAARAAGQTSADDAEAITPPTSAAATPPALSSNKPRDLSLPSFESATIHVARPPIAILVPVPLCAERSRLTLDGDVVPSDAQGAVLLLGAGSHSIRAQCGSEMRQTRLWVKRDAAKMDLPKRAQNVHVEADGRRYTVRYQNLLPVVTFAWPRAPSGALTLFIKKGARETSHALERPELALGSGALGEGEYKFHFRAADGAVSPVSRLRLSFDNTARSAYLSAPADGSTAPSDGVEVAGAALLRSRVRVQEQPVELDDKGRFRTHVQPRQGESAVTVRVEHPESGVHYYVRRVR